MQLNKNFPKFSGLLPGYSFTFNIYLRISDLHIKKRGKRHKRRGFLLKIRPWHVHGSLCKQEKPRNPRDLLPSGQIKRTKEKHEKPLFRLFSLKFWRIASARVHLDARWRLAFDALSTSFKFDSKVEVNERISRPHFRVQLSGLGSVWKSGKIRTGDIRLRSSNLRRLVRTCPTWQDLS